MHSKLSAVLLLLLVLAVSACAMKYTHYMREDYDLPSMVGTSYYLASNQHIHRDEVRDVDNKKMRQINSVNYQYGEVLPWGTHVTVKGIKSTRVLLVTDDGTQYDYVMHGRTLKTVPPSEHLARVLVPELEPLQVAYASMSPRDQAGIDAAKPLPGMTKAGVLMAIGYPPEFMGLHPMDQERWTYWDAISGQFILIFDGDTLKSVID